MVDVHCHLTDGKYQKSKISVENILEAIVKADIKIISNGSGIDDSYKTIAMAERWNQVFVCVGTSYEPGVKRLGNIKTELTQMAAGKKVVGIGETGLNFWEDMPSDLKLYQERLFEIHLEVATELGLPIQIHNRGADIELFKLLESGYKVLRGKILLHCFSGTKEHLERMKSLDCYFSFGGNITYKKNEWLREVVKCVPPDRLLLETDSPYLPPEPLRGSINEPNNVKIVANEVAKIRGTTIEEIDRLTSENAMRLFPKLV